MISFTQTSSVLFSSLLDGLLIISHKIFTQLFSFFSFFTKNCHRQENVLNKFSPLVLQMNNPMTDHVKRSVEWDPKRGFKIPLKPYDSYQMITCVTSVDENKFSSVYMLLRISESFQLKKRKSQLRNYLLKSVIKNYKSFFHDITWIHVDTSCSWCLATDLKNIAIKPERPRVVVGDSLILNCSAETTYNGYLDFKWQLPKGQVSYQEMKRC